MATRKPKNPELAAAASNLGVAARHLRRAVKHKVDELEASASTELGKASLTVSLKAWHYTHLFILHMRNDGCKRTI